MSNNNNNRISNILSHISSSNDNNFNFHKINGNASGLQNILFGNYNKESLRCLKWLEQKDKLNQDIFLVSEGGPLSRWIALHYCAINNKQFQYLSLTRDTCESDLKQRREIINGHSIFIDQPIIHAALEGHVLILEGLEKAERNVLPVLNNLLENREMALEDGRFLISPQRFKSLLDNNHSKDELEKRGLIPVSDKFRVIAIGLPVPPFSGNPLDPPLRSRFQSYNINNISTSVLVSVIKSFYASSKYSHDSIHLLLSIVKTIKYFGNQQANRSGVDHQLIAYHHLPHVGEIGLLSASRTFELFPSITINSIFNRIYPWKYAITNENAIKLVQEAIEPLNNNTDTIVSYLFISSKRIQNKYSSSVPESSLQFINGNTQFPTLQDIELTFKSISSNITYNNNTITITVSGGPNYLHNSSILLNPKGFSSYHHHILSQILQSHAANRDICLIGNKGEGKSYIISEFAQILGYSCNNINNTNLQNVSVEPLFLYKDMSARDLLQRRTTNSSGETIWQVTPLVRAIRLGGLAVLDGIHRLPLGSIGILLRLIQDRELSLFDGSKFIRWDRYCYFKNKLNISDKQMRCQYKLYPIHPCFRIIATALPPSRANPWLSNELLHLFEFHSVDLFDNDNSSLESNSVAYLLKQITPNASWEFLCKLEQLGKRMRELVNDPIIQLENPISLRQLIRLAKRSLLVPNENYYTLCNILMIKFMPQQQQLVIEQILKEIGLSEKDLELSDNNTIKSNTNNIENKIITTPIKNTNEYILTIGSVCMKVKPPNNPELVPDVLFYNIPKHVIILQAMLKDFIQGEHILLIGNQGVGKNKLTDKLLQLMQREREYIQLHRDTTVQSLTLSPALEKGIVVWKDSPLVRAMKYGRVLVIDEADKAPTEVVCVLKALLEDGEILLSDGRRFVSSRSRYHENKTNQDNNTIIRSNNSFNYKTDNEIQVICNVHPEFRVIALANRPGYPFLGNDFFGEMGDVLASYPIDNPDPISEFQLLKSYAPDVDEEILKRLTAVFQDLRDMNEEGLLTYPYSTRELVNIVRHLQYYPSDTLGSVLKNVFDFDRYDIELLKLLYPVFHKHGIPMLAPDEIHLSSNDTSLNNNKDIYRGEDNMLIKISKSYPLPPIEIMGRGFISDDISLSIQISDPIILQNNEILINSKFNTKEKALNSRKNIWTEEIYHFGHLIGTIINVFPLKYYSPREGRFVIITNNPFNIFIYTINYLTGEYLYSQFILDNIDIFINSVLLSSIIINNNLIIYEGNSSTITKIPLHDNNLTTSIRLQIHNLPKISNKYTSSLIILDSTSKKDSLLLYWKGYNIIYFISLSDNFNQLQYSFCEFSFNINNINIIYPSRLSITSDNNNIYDIFLFYHSSRMSISHSVFNPSIHGIPTHLSLKQIQIRYKNHRDTSLDINIISTPLETSLSSSLTGILKNASKKQILNPIKNMEPITESIRSKEIINTSINENFHIIGTNEGYAAIYYNYPNEFKPKDITIVGMDQVLFTTGIYPRNEKFKDINISQKSISIWIESSKMIGTMITFYHFELIDIINSCYRRIILPNYNDIREKETLLPQKLLQESQVISIIELYNGKILITHKNGLLRLIETNITSLQKQLRQINVELQNKKAQTISIKEEQEKQNEKREDDKDVNDDFNKYPF